MKKYLFALALVLPLFAQDKIMEVYKGPACGCCGLWESYMQKKTVIKSILIRVKIF